MVEHFPQILTSEEKVTPQTTTLSFCLQVLSEYSGTRDDGLLLL